MLAKRDVTSTYKIEMTFSARVDYLMFGSLPILKKIFPQIIFHILTIPFVELNMRLLNLFFGKARTQDINVPFREASWQLKIFLNNKWTSMNFLEKYLLVVDVVVQALKIEKHHAESKISSKEH